MPLVKASDVKKLAEFEKGVGIDNGAPEGTHTVAVERAEVRRPEGEGFSSLFTLLRVKGGDADNRTIPISFRWDVSTTDAEGNEKDEKKLRQGRGFVRQQTMAFAKATLGKDIGSWPDSVLLPSDDSTDDEVAEAFETIAEATKGLSLNVKVTNRKDSDFQNFAYSEAKEQTAFKL